MNVVVDVVAVPVLGVVEGGVVGRGPVVVAAPVRGEVGWVASACQLVLDGDTPGPGSPVGFRLPQHTVPVLTTTPPQAVPL